MLFAAQAAQAAKAATEQRCNDVLGSARYDVQLLELQEKLSAAEQDKTRLAAELHFARQQLAAKSEVEPCLLLHLAARTRTCFMG